MVGEQHEKFQLKSAGVHDLEANGQCLCTSLGSNEKGYTVIMCDGVGCFRVVFRGALRIVLMSSDSIDIMH